MLKKSSKAKIKKYQRAFHEFDEDNSGEIDCVELQKVFNALGQTPTEAEVKAMIDEVDADGSGTIGFDEFLTLMTHPDRALVQSPEDAAIQHAADEAGCEGEIASFLGPIEDHWKNTITRWFHLDKVAFEDDYSRPLPCWTEKDLRSRKWFPLISI